MKKLLVILGVLGAVFTALPKAIIALAPAFQGERPDITPAMVFAVIKFACVQGIALGLMSPGTQTYILQVAGIVVPAVLVIADLGLRSARNKADLAKVLLPES